MGRQMCPGAGGRRTMVKEVRSERIGAFLGKKSQESLRSSALASQASVWDSVFF